jgi:hypothetical protein
VDITLKFKVNVKFKVKVKVEIAIKEGSNSEEGIAQKEEVICQEFLCKEGIVVQQSEVFAFVIESFQGRSKVAGGMELQDKILNWFGGNEKQELP